MGAAISPERTQTGLDERTARALLEARAARTALVRFPGVLPKTLDAAYALQDRMIRLADRHLAGWKVAKVAASMVPALGTSYVFGPVFAHQVHSPRNAPALHRAIEGGFCGGEGEILAVIAEPDQDATICHWRGHGIALHAGIEIAGTCCPAARSSGPIGSVADFASNDGLVIGGRLSDNGLMAVIANVDGREVGRAEIEPRLATVEAALNALTSNLTARGHRLTRGHVVATGALTGVHELHPGQRFAVRFGDQQALELQLSDKSA